jgi:hypothetical protein
MADNITVLDSSAAPQTLGYKDTGTFKIAESTPMNVSGVSLVASNNADAVAAAALSTMGVSSFIYGFNGATFDRLQVDGSKNLKVSQATAIPAGTNTVGAVLGVTTEVTVTPTVTASAYAANNVLGGIMTFAAALPATFSGILQSITAKFKGTAVTGNINVAIFKASPSNGTYTDHAAPTWNAADMANLLGIYQLTTPLALGAATMTVYDLDGIGKTILGAATSLYAVVTVGGTPTPASTTDFSLALGVLQG